MATKKTEKSTAKKSAGKAARHPMARVKAAFGDKESLVKSLVEPLTAAGDDVDALRARLLKASNQQLLRLAKVTAQVKDKYGSRDKLIKSIGESMNKDDK